MGVSGDCDPLTSIVGDGSPEKAQIAGALRVAALVAASPDLAQMAIGAPAERRKDRRDPRGRGNDILGFDFKIEWACGLGG
jgi:hypothetical protein